MKLGDQVAELEEKYVRKTEGYQLQYEALARLQAENETLRGAMDGALADKNGEWQRGRKSALNEVFEFLTGPDPAAGVAMESRRRIAGQIAARFGDEMSRGEH